MMTTTSMDMMTTTMDDMTTEDEPRSDGLSGQALCHCGQHNRKRI